jgi:hypothetical protein
MAGTVVLLAATQAKAFDRCKTEEMLTARVRAELKVYADAIAVLQQYSMAALSVLDDTRECFQKAHKLAEHARLAYQASRRQLDRHIATHGCG